MRWPHNIFYYVALAAMALSLGGCNKTPEGVLHREEMAQLMADIHMGEAVIDFNYSDYPNDSTRKALKQSIYLAHKVTPEIVDSSFSYYGHHLEDYMKVYERTIEILENRQKQYAATSANQQTITGDSVVVWTGPERLRVYPGMVSRIIPFEFNADSTWHKGDIYTLRIKVLNTQPDIAHRLMVDYSNGTTGYVEDAQWLTGNAKQLTIQVDSTLTPTRVYGYLLFSPSTDNDFEMDSITITRLRHNLKPQHLIYNQKRFTYQPNTPKQQSSAPQPTVFTPTLTPHISHPQHSSRPAIGSSCPSSASSRQATTTSSRQSTSSSHPTLRRPVTQQHQPSASSQTRQQSH